LSYGSRAAFNQSWLSADFLWDSATVQRLDPLNEFFRKRNRRLEHHSAQGVPVRSRTAIETEPCIDVDQGTTTVDEIGKPDRPMPEVDSDYAVPADAQDLTLDRAGPSTRGLAIH